MQTEQGDKTIIGLDDDGFRIIVIPKEQMVVNGELVQDVCQFGLKAGSTVSRQVVSILLCWGNTVSLACVQTARLINVGTGGISTCRIWRR